MKKISTVAVCGVQPRIGTTTQALQIVGYLQMMGYSAAYIELSRHGYIENMRKLYRDISISGSCVSYGQLDMYRSVVDVRSEEDYDFLIKDYGAMDEADFNKVSFLEQDIQIICGGVKPNEIFKVNDILKLSEYYPVRFIFSFVPHDQKDGIIQLMTNRADKTFFANYNADPFVYDSTMNKSYRQILGKYMDGTPAMSGSKSKHMILKNIKQLFRGQLKIIFEKRIVKLLLLIIYTVVILVVTIKIS